MELNGDYAESRKRRSIKICVDGYDTWLPEDDVKSALRKHFSSCGEIVHIYIPRDVGSDILNRYAFVFILGEGAEEKALKLSGTDVGGWTVIARSHTNAYSLGESQQGSPVRVIRRPSGPTHKFFVTGFDYSLPSGAINRLLRNHFSSCGVVGNVAVMAIGRPESVGVVNITGEGAVEKAQKLSGCDVGGLKIVVKNVLPHFPHDSRGGYTHDIKRLKKTATAMKKKTTE